MPLSSFPENVLGIEDKTIHQWFTNLKNENYYDLEGKMEVVETAFTRKTIEPKRRRVMVLKTSSFCSLIWAVQETDGSLRTVMIMTVGYFKLK